MVKGIIMNRSVLNAIIVVGLCCLPLVVIGVVGYSRSQITPNDQFFTVQIGDIPNIDVENWTLIIDGHIDNPINFTYAEFIALPSVAIRATLQCVDGPAGTAIWRGVPISDLLAMAQVNQSGFDVVFYAVDGFSSSLTVQEVNAGDVLLAYEMNGVPLPAEHGFPVRVVAPAHSGYKWVKWIDHIEVVDYDFRGFWESRGWADDARLSPISHWGTHAFLFSISFIAGAVALVSGLKFTRRTNYFIDLPDFFSTNFHRIMSVVYVGTVVAVFIYWAIQTILLKGALLYTFHGIGALAVIILHIVGGITGRPTAMTDRKNRRRHFIFNVSGYIIYTLTITAGFLLAFGANILYIY
jgi:hypothetical protein